MAENGDAGKENGMKTLLISACLLGVRCRYDGGSKPQPGVEELAGRYRLIPVCPEQLGGLPTPRAPSERQGDRVVSRQGRDVTAEYRRGACGCWTFSTRRARCSRSAARPAGRA